MPMYPARPLWAHQTEAGRSRRKALIEMYLIAALRMAPSPLRNIWAGASCSAINFRHCRTLSFFMPRDPSLIHARKVSRPSVSERKTCRGRECSAGRRQRSTASSLGKESGCAGRQISHEKICWRVILLFKCYVIDYCHCYECFSLCFSLTLDKSCLAICKRNHF